MSWAKLSVKVPEGKRSAEFIITHLKPFRVGLLILKPGYRIPEYEINFDWDVIISFNWEASCVFKRLDMKIPEYFESHKYFKEDPDDPRASYRRR